MAKAAYPMTRGVRLLRAHKINFTPHLYAYEEHGGTRHAATCLAVDEHCVIKTLVMESDTQKPFLVLMHGDCNASTKNLARSLGYKSVKPCRVETAARITGYQVGGISPFGTRRPLPVYVEAGILHLPHFYINGGKRGFLVQITPADLEKTLSVTPVNVAVTIRPDSNNR